ncbi:MAG TPA: metalloregulator ArsR/SmtB family transcription factor [Phototrophicaceae bacterium]|nr:metalloregulator ArsR/SmtB family transcription factor [Phototrophicaceae bacterium]
MDAELIKELTLLHEQVCDALGSPIRLMIFYALNEGARNVTDLAAELDLPQPTVSRHLRVLRERGLVSATREGPAVYYALTDDRVMQALDLMRSVLRDRVRRQAQITEKLN